MSFNYDPLTKFERLRAAAERIIKARPDMAAHIPDDPLELIHELKIHQAELEVQNEELRRSQNELSDLHAQYVDLYYDLAPCGYLTLNPGGLITKINLTGAILLGIEEKYLLHLPFSNLIKTEYHDFYYHALNKADNAGTKQTVELKLGKPKKVEAPLWVRADIKTDLDANGNVIQRRMILTDISAKIEAEIALRKSEEQFRELFEDAPVAYQSLDHRGDILTVNQAWLTTLGYFRSDVIGKNFAEFLHPEWRDSFKEYYRRCGTQKGVPTVEFVVRKKEGTDILVTFHANIVKGITGDIKQAHCVLHDITAQRKAEEEKKQLEEQQWHSRKMESLGTLTGGIAHEVNNVLAIIMGNCELALCDVPVWSPASANLKEIMTASTRAKDMVKQLLTFSRKREALKEPLDTKAVVKDALKLIRSSIPTNINIKEVISDDVDPIVGNATQINQLLINLCINAADAMQTTGDTMTIVLTNRMVSHKRSHGHYTLLPGQYVQLAVSDNGGGMDAETLMKIFDPFFTTKAVDKGTGLGLAVVHGIVDRHEGVIAVKSNSGRGTIFKILFPAYKGTVDQVDDGRKVLPTGTERILFVDDEPSILKLFKQSLGNLGYRVVAVINPIDALKQFEADPDGFDLVITDMCMPNMTGDRLTAKIRSIRPQIPIMLCTGYSEKISQEKAQAMGISSFIAKPIDQTYFAQSIRTVLDKVTSEAGEINQY